MAKTVEFNGEVVREIWSDEESSFRIYALNVKEEEIEKHNLKRSKYGNVVISGTLHELGVGLDYQIKAEETTGKNGYSYKVEHISRKRPQNSDDMYIFLHEILTPLQAKALWDVYPDIVQRVIDNNLSDIDLNKTCGIKEARFASIKKKIEDNYALAEMVIEFKGILTMSMINKLYNHYSSLNVLKMKLKENPYKCLTRLDGIGFKKADAIALELEKENIVNFGFSLKTSKERCLGACLFLLNDNEKNGNTKMSLIELRKQVLKLVPACADKFVQALKESVIYYDKDEMVVSLRKTYNTESYIAKSINNAVHIKNKWNIDISKYKFVEGCELSEEQQKVNKLLCENQIVILAGFAGSGKTYSTQSVLQMCKDNKKEYLCLSSTGKAAKVLSDYIKENAKTVHRGLGFPCVESSNGWAYNLENKLDVDLVIVDEFSMIDVFLFEHIIDAIDFKRTKLLVIGDPAQCSSVGAGNVLYDMIQSNVVPKVILTKIFRYSEGGLMTVATDVRNGKSYLNNINSTMTTFGKNKDYTYIKCRDSEIIKNTIGLYKKILSKEWQESKNINLQPTDIQVLTAKNVGEYGTEVLNKELQKIANPNYLIGNSLQVGNTVFYEGDLIIQMQNNYKAQLYIDGWTDDMIINSGFANDKGQILIANGETATIKQIKNDKFEQYIILDFDGVEVKYSKNDMSNVSLGYAISMHKSQGSGIKIPIIVEPRSHIFMDTSNLLYVALTRTKLMCFHLGLPETINTCIKRKESLRRNTFLLNMLKGE